MKIMIIEWLNGGGLWFDTESVDPQNPFLKQGRAMHEAVARDFVELGHQVHSTIDNRLDVPLVDVGTTIVSGKNELRPAIVELADQADGILVIAPETGGCLSMVLHWLTRHKEKIIGPDAEFVALAAEKQATSNWLLQRGVSAPMGALVPRLQEARYLVPAPAIAKPNLGAGSDQICLIEDWGSIELPDAEIQWRVEEYIEGQSVSVSIISGGHQNLVLTPTRQSFDRPLGHYVGALHPLEDDVAARAIRLAQAAAAALPATTGYFGIDMIIGDRACVVDVNPRLTMSYTCLREIEPFNLAKKMLEMANLNWITA